VQYLFKSVIYIRTCAKTRRILQFVSFKHWRFPRAAIAGTLITHVIFLDYTQLLPTSYMRYVALGF